MNHPQEGSAITPGKALTQNIDTLMRIRKIESHQDLADRMAEIGFGWQRRTVGRIFSDDPRQRRRIHTDEIYGLALALGTTVEQLLTPGLDERIEGKQTPAVWIRVGSLEEVPYPTIAAVVRDPSLDDHPVHEPAIGVDFDLDGYWRIPVKHGVDTITDGLAWTLAEWDIPVPEGADPAEIMDIYQSEINRRLDLG